MLCQMRNKRLYDTKTITTIKTKTKTKTIIKSRTNAEANAPKAHTNLLFLIPLVSILLFSLCVLNLNVVYAGDDTDFSSSTVVKNIGEKKCSK